MKIKYLVISLIIFSILIFGCTPTEIADAMEKKDKVDEVPIGEVPLIENPPNLTPPIGPIGSNEQNDSAMIKKSDYKGEVLTGTESTKYLEFNKADYDKALKEKRKILLYFYANWCPLCRAEQPETFAAFNEINDPELIGFRVNYRDGDDDADEKALAQEFGVGYQHTKVILKDGQRVGKWPDTWDKQRYLDELNKI